MRTTFFLLAFLALPGQSFAEPPSLPWPQFRGPDGQGHAAASGIPVTFGETENLVWKTLLPGQGWSSPVSDGRLLWMTTALDADSPKGNGQAPGKSLRALGVAVKTGRLVHDVEVFRAQRPLPVNARNSHASPTPVLDGERVYVHFGSYGTACLDAATAKVLWRDTEHPCNHSEGPGSSPVLYDNLLIFHCDGIDVQYVVALDKFTGRVVWKTDRSGKLSDSPQERKAFCTPLVVKVADRDVLVSPGAFHVWAYDPRTGKELWRVRTAPYFSTVPRPVFGHGLVYLSPGYFRPNFLAIRPDGTGDVTETHVAWKYPRRVPTNPSPLLVGEELYLFADNSFATCLNARTGEELWVQRLGGNFWSSPLYVDGRIYAASEEGKIYVLQPGRQYKLLATNEVKGRVMASPAVVDGALFFRTDQALYRFEKR
jgi:outer membrane protein assembly factor BamB